MAWRWAVCFKFPWLPFFFRKRPSPGAGLPVWAQVFSRWNLLEPKPSNLRNPCWQIGRPRRVNERLSSGRSTNCWSRSRRSKRTTWPQGNWFYMLRGLLEDIVVFTLGTAMLYCGGPIQRSHILLDLEALFSRPPGVHWIWSGARGRVAQQEG